MIQYVGKQSYELGYSLKYALRHPRKTAHRLPNGWRWLKTGETVQAGDVCCDRRIAPVKILVSGSWTMTPAHHPVRTRRKS